MSERWVHDAITIIGDINKLEFESEYMHLLRVDYLTVMKNLEVLGLQVQVLDLSTKSFDKETGKYTDQLYNIGLVTPKKDFEEFVRAVYNELGKAYNNKAWEYVKTIGRLIHLIDSQAVRPILIYNSFMKRNGVNLDNRFKFSVDYNKEWKQVFDAWMRYAEYLPLLSHVKIEYEKAVNAPGVSYLDYFSSLSANNDWGVLSKVIIGENEELKVLGHLDNSSLDALAASVVVAIARMHRIDTEERYIRDITFSQLMTTVFELHHQAFKFSAKDLGFILFILKQLDFIYSVLDRTSSGRFETECQQVKEITEMLQKMSSSFIKT